MSSPLTVYGTGWCPQVQQVRDLLDRREIPYDYFDIDEDKKAQKAVRRLQRGARRVPTVVLPDGGHLVEPTDEELLLLLGDTPSP